MTESAAARPVGKAIELRESGRRRVPPWLVQLACAAFGGVVAVAAMGATPALAGGFALGLLGCVVCVGALTLLFVAPRQPASTGVEVARLASPALQIVLGGGVCWGALCLVVAGSLGRAFVAPLGLAITASFLWCAAAALVLLRRLGAYGSSAPARFWQHHGLWLVALTTAVYLPRLGAFGLVDPWETHYGEVAREMLARRDWISLWWAQDGWFWSKPVLDFWVQGLSFAALGVHASSDQMLAGVEAGIYPGPEWAARMPIFVSALLGQYALYLGARLHFGRRAAWLGGLVLATCPYWYFLAHQSMVDMVYVAPLCGAMGLFLVALSLRRDWAPAGCGIRLGPRGLLFTLTPKHLLVASVLAVAVPQVLYLVSRNASLSWDGAPFGFYLHADDVSFGSPGNCGLPGNRGCRSEPGPGRAALQPLWTGLAAAGGLAVWALIERRRFELKRACYLGAWLLCGLSFMAKGAPGPVLIVFTLLGVAVSRRRYRELWEAAPISAALVLLCASAPWFIQEYVRHGRPFVERLFVHDMVKRAFEHVHDTNAGDDTSFRYYLWQLGYGLFPWSGLALSGVLAALARLTESRPQAEAGGAGAAAVRSDTGAALELLLIWQLCAFGMFSITGTKFHHYIFPLAPAAALLAGLLLDELWSQRAPLSGRELALLWGGSAATACLLAFGADALLSGSFSGEPGGEPAWLWGLGAAALGSLAAAGLGWRLRAPSGGSSPEGSALPMLALGGAVGAALVGRDLFVSLPRDVEGQSRLLSLFCYVYDRPWPESLDFRGWLGATALVGSLACGVLAAPRLRRLGVGLVSAAAVLVAAWGVNVYLPAISPHWGQRETVQRYYEERAGPEEPLVAYQLNWKGENFYTGNHVPAFVSSGKKFKDWVAQKKKDGTKVMFFTTEFTRVGTLKRELGEVASFREVTGRETNNKFLLMRVEL